MPKKNRLGKKRKKINKKKILKKRQKEIDQG